MQQSGLCQKGDACTFAHSLDELAPEARPEGIPSARLRWWSASTCASECELRQGDENLLETSQLEEIEAALLGSDLELEAGWIIPPSTFSKPFSKATGRIPFS